MKVKLFLDEDVHSALAIALRKRGYDVIHAQELQGKGKSDDEQLSYAIKEKRCLFSFNVKDFVLLHNKYVQNRWEHYGIMISKQLTVGETMRRLLKILQIFSQASIKNRLEFL